MSINFGLMRSKTLFPYVFFHYWILFLIEAINVDDMRLSLPHESLVFVICYWCLSS